MLALSMWVSSILVTKEWLSFLFVACSKENLHLLSKYNLEETRNIFAILTHFRIFYDENKNIVIYWNYIILNIYKYIHKYIILNNEVTQWNDTIYYKIYKKKTRNIFVISTHFRIFYDENKNIVIYSNYIILNTYKYIILNNEATQ